MTEKRLLKQKLNKPLIGVLIGLILPIIVLIVFYFIRAGEGMKIFNYYKILSFEGAFLPVMSLATLINLIPFYIFKHFELWYANRGIVFSIFLYVIAVVILKFA